MMQVIRHWHSFVEIEIPEGSFLIDPFITGNPKCDVTVEQIIEKNILWIFLTHGHGDHIGDTVAIQQATKTDVVCELWVAKYLATDHGIEAIKWGIWATVECGIAKVKFCTAIHGGDILDTHYICVPAWLLITIAGKNIYHAGDTSLTYDLKLLGEYEKISVACVPIWDFYTMWVVDGARAVGYIKPEMAFPIHYDTRPTLRVDAIDWARLVMQDTKTVPKVLKPWQYVVVETGK